VKVSLSSMRVHVLSLTGSQTDSGRGLFNNTEKSAQKFNLSETCMMRGARAVLGAPKAVLVWRPAASKIIAPLMSVKFVWLKTLYISQRNCSPRSSPRRKFLNMARSVLKIEGRRIWFLPMLPMSPNCVGRAKQEVSIR
jgi:hypothetical protein